MKPHPPEPERIYLWIAIAAGLLSLAYWFWWTVTGS